MADGATLWTEEKLKTLIEKIITRALDEQQENLFKTTNCWAKKESQRIKTKHRAYWKRLRRRGSTRKKEFRTHWESRTGNVSLSARPRFYWS